MCCASSGPADVTPGLAYCGECVSGTDRGQPVENPPRHPLRLTPFALGNYAYFRSPDGLRQCAGGGYAPYELIASLLKDVKSAQQHIERYENHVGRVDRGGNLW